MKTKIALVVAVLAFIFVASASAQDSAGKTDWRGQYAYMFGVQAYVFGFPYVYLPTLRADWVTRPKAADITPYAPINNFSHVRNLADASFRSLERLEVNMETMTRTVVPFGISCSRFRAGDEL